MVEQHIPPRPREKMGSILSSSLHLSTSKISVEGFYVMEAGIFVEDEEGVAEVQCLAVGHFEIFLH